MEADDSARITQIAAGLSSARQRIAAAAAAAGRDVDAIGLVVVTKTFPATDVEILRDLGCRDVGENRDQEARAKRAEVGDGPPLRWHMIGQLQTNKARAVLTWADVVESVDRSELVAALGKAAAAADRTLDVLIQVNLDPEPSPGRGGVVPADLPALIESVLATSNLNLCGLMGVAPHPGDPRAAFDRLAAYWTVLHRVAPQARVLSAGMSDDLEAAVAAGATQVRLGSAVLGYRQNVQ